MLYLRVTVVRAAYCGENPEYFEHTAHAVADLEDTPTAATWVTDTLTQDGWSLVDAIFVRRIHPGERFTDDPCLAQVLKEAESSGFSYFLELGRHGASERALE
jgi:hypothetical protein